MRGTGVHAVLGKNSLLRHRVTTLKCPLRVRERRKRGVITQCDNLVRKRKCSPINSDIVRPWVYFL